jgi:SAM-dependent methyltransferase
MKTQAEIFLHDEGNAWLERNRAKLGEHDMVSHAMEQLNIRPRLAVEIGSANGWRLANIREKYGCDVIGVEPSRIGCDESRARGILTYQAAADHPMVPPGSADLLIYGFCLYLADPEDWFRIVMQGDRILKLGGHLIIHDFAAVDYPFARPYKHCEGVTAYHVDFAKFWEANPLYVLKRRAMAYEHDQMVTVLRKLPPVAIEMLPDGENP